MCLSDLVLNILALFAGTVEKLRDRLNQSKFLTNQGEMMHFEWK